MKSAGKARSNGLYRHIRTSKEIIRNLLNYFIKYLKYEVFFFFQKRFSEYRNKRKGFSLQKGRRAFFMQKTTENTENTQKRERKKG